MSNQVDQFMAKLRGTIKKNMERAAITLVNDCKETLNVTGNPYKAGSGEKGICYKNENPSEPGDAPHKMLGDLQRSVTYQMSEDGLTAYVGTSNPVGLWTELGTSKMAARPWLRPTLLLNQDKLARIISQGK